MQERNVFSQGTTHFKNVLKDISYKPFLHLLQFYKCLFLLIKIVSSAFMKALFYKISCDGAKEFLHLKNERCPLG